MGDGLEVSAIGLGGTGLRFGPRAATANSETLTVIRGAADRGVTVLDTAQPSGPDKNEALLGEALQSVRVRRTFAALPDRNPRAVGFPGSSPAEPDCPLIGRLSERGRW